MSMIVRDGGGLTSLDTLAGFGESLRLYTAEGDASPLTIKNYHTQGGQFVKWCDALGVKPAAATDRDVIAYRIHLVEAGFTPSTVARKNRLIDLSWSEHGLGER
ncbi:hypothetical protein ACFLWA_10885 [Chloroflexota bacterium]